MTGREGRKSRRKEGNKKAEEGRKPRKETKE